MWREQWETGRDKEIEEHTVSWGAIVVCVPKFLSKAASAQLVRTSQEPDRQHQ